MTNTYGNDSIWSLAKRVAKKNSHENDWVYAVTLYTMNNGRHTMVYGLGNSTMYRIIAMADNGETIIENHDGSLGRMSTQDAVKSKKVFEYSDTPLADKVDIKLSDTMVMGSHDLTYYR